MILDAVRELVLRMSDVIDGVTVLEIVLVVAIVTLLAVEMTVLAGVVNDVGNLDLELRSLDRAVKVHEGTGHRDVGIMLIAVATVRIVLVRYHAGRGGPTEREDAQNEPCRPGATRFLMSPWK